MNTRRVLRATLTCLLSLALFGPRLFPAQPAPIFEGAPPAEWIAPPGVRGDAYGVFHFRRVLELDRPPASFVVHVSADNRYRLFVNGASVATGPQRSDLSHWRYETLDLAPQLRAGRNVLAAVVWNWGEHQPVAQFSRRTAFLVQAHSPREAIANTGSGWKVLANPAYSPLPITTAQLRGYYASPPGEEVDGARYPWGWEQSGYDDSAWQKPVPALGARVSAPQLRGTDPNGASGGWQLVARTLPPMEETPVRFAQIRRAAGLAADDGFLRGTQDLVVPPRTKAVLLLDQGYVTNAYPVLRTSGGAGAAVSLMFAEALKDADGKKGHRNEIDGKTLLGVRDVFRPDGGAGRRFQSLWFRTYRYVQMEISTADEPLRVHEVSGLFTGYPFAEKARFRSDLPWLADMWTMNWRTARICAWETYFDTPYWEQLQYVGDTRIQGLISLYVSGDARLWREAIFHYDVSRAPEGITGSRYPSSLPQYIPPFSLFWVAMVHDYWMHRDDPGLIRSLLPGVRAVLGFYEQRLRPDGLVGPVPWWNFTDWADAWRRGVPPGADAGGSAAITLQFVYALERGAVLEETLGRPSEAERYRALAAQVRAAVRTHCWNDARGLFADTPELLVFSQQTNTLAILTDTAPTARQAALLERLLTAPGLVPASYYFGFYVREALRHAGLGDRYIELLQPWREMLALGLTTTPERQEPTRSDTHAWSAHPNYGLFATVLGIRPLAPGFKSVLVAPHPGPLGEVEGSMPHPQGEIAVKLQRTATGGYRAAITLPPGTDGVLEWKDRRQPLRAGSQQIDL